MTGAEDRRELHGVLPMLVTPYAADGTVAIGQLQAVAAAALADGADGLSVNGLGGEAAWLTADERAATARAAVAVAAGAPVVVGVSADATELARRLALDAATAGAAAVMLAPSPAIGSRDDLLGHFATVAADVAPLPVMVQDAPTFVGVGLDARFVLELRAAHANVRHAKPESLPAADAVAAVRRVEGLSVFAGHGGLYLLDALEAGADGVIPGCEATRPLVESHRAWRRGDVAGARERFGVVLPLLVAEFQSLTGFIGAAKAILRARGLIASEALRPPSPPLAPVTRRQVLDHAMRAGIPLGARRD